MGEARIGCLGWGSLLWDPRSLPTADVFRDDGPELPIDFSRVSTDGRATLVIDPEAPPARTAWVPLSVPTLDDAIAGLGRRERVKPDRWGQWIAGQDVRGEVRGEVSDATRDRVAAWLEALSVEAVVWTALPARCPDGRFARPSDIEMLDHLRGLEGPARVRAEEYVRRAPTLVRTPRRALFERELGWSPTNEPANEATPDAHEEPIT